MARNVLHCSEGYFCKAILLLHCNWITFVASFVYKRYKLDTLTLNNIQANERCLAILDHILKLLSYFKWIYQSALHCCSDHWIGLLWQSGFEYKFFDFSGSIPSIHRPAGGHSWLVVARWAFQFHFQTSPYAWSICIYYNTFSHWLNRHALNVATTILN